MRKAVKMHMNKKTLKDLNIKGKKVFCRVDFNVTMNNGEITDNTRMKAALPTITYLIEQGAQVILATHLDRPKGEVVEALRLDAIADDLGKLLGQSVKKANHV